jgi:ABC-type microcin C transport system permease subunit YejB
MLAFTRMMFPLVPLLLGICLGALAVMASRPGGRNKARIAELRARIEALERKP